MQYFVGLFTLCLPLAIKHTYVKIIQQKMGVPHAPLPMPWVGSSVQASREENANKQFSICLRAHVCIGLLPLKDTAHAVCMSEHL